LRKTNTPRIERMERTAALEDSGPVTVTNEGYGHGNIIVTTETKCKNYLNPLTMPGHGGGHGRRHGHNHGHGRS